jgi:hypothetical protein
MRNSASSARTSEESAASCDFSSTDIVMSHPARLVMHLSCHVSLTTAGVSQNREPLGIHKKHPPLTSSAPPARWVSPDRMPG